MGVFGKRKRNVSIERELRAGRPEPRRQYVDELAAAVHLAVRPRRSWSRAAFAAGVATFMLGTFASFGGLSYAAAGTASTVDTVKRIVIKRETVVRKDSSANQQYSQPKETVVAVQKDDTKPSGVAGETARTGTPSSGTLPFTGSALAGTAALGLAFIGLGVMLRRRETASQTE